MKKHLFAAILLMLMAQSANALPPGERININTADAATLAEVIDGVGLRRAEAIVRYRDENGAFKDVLELTNVKGIGEHTVTQNQDRLSVK
ncbi:MAG: helix-hairpin-helix domain-containing protein [Proteobacteria bacterium]|nr:helix-hairpin-helix domain-containing protein [Pseudomonadota bacterium]